MGDGTQCRNGVAGLRCVDRSFILTGGKAKCRWLDLVVETCGNSLLFASIFLVKYEARPPMGTGMGSSIEEM